MDREAGPCPLRVSAIIPVHNGAPFLADAIASVRAQDSPSLEILVVDDGSTDDTAAVAASFGSQVRYVFQENRGPAAARNRGIEAASGDVMAFLDADDLWTVNRLEPLLAVLRLRPDVDIVMGHSRSFDDGQPMPLATGVELAPESRRAPRPPFLAFLIGSAIVRRSLLERIGGFDETLRFGEDVEWFMRAREEGARIRVLKLVALLYRVHAGSFTHTVKARDDYGLARVFRRSIERRRQAGGGAVRELTPLEVEVDG
jgi:glycosyltransferase involved in cell wall biosynthesis